MTQRRIHQYEYPYFVTFRTRVDLLLFEDTEYAEILGRIMVNAGRLKRFDILAYQIMPDHVHVLVKQNTYASAAAESRARDGGKCIRPQSPPRISVSAVGDAGYTISQFMYTVKSYFAKQIRVKYDIPYSILQPRFYARIVDNDGYLRTVIEYITFNPIKSELPAKYHMAPYQFVDGKKINRLL